MTKTKYGFIEKNIFNTYYVYFYNKGYLKDRDGEKIDLRKNSALYMIENPVRVTNKEVK